MLARRMTVASVFFALTCLPVVIAQEKDRKKDDRVKRLIRQLEQEIKGKGGRPIIPGGKSGADSEAAKALGKLGPRAAPAVPVLIRAIKEGKGLMPAQAGYALGQIGKPAVPALVKALSSNDQGLQSQAIHALGMIGKDASSAIPPLLKLTRADDSQLRSRATETLATIAPTDNDKVVTVLIGRLDDKESSVQTAAAKGLSRFVARSKEAEKGLIAVLKDAKKSSNARSAAAKSLGRVNRVSDQVISALTDALQSSDANLQVGAASALARMGPKAKPAMPDLVAFLKSSDKPPADLSGGAITAWKLLHDVARTNAKLALNRIKKDSK